MKNEQAFTLIELLVVVLIIGILAAVALPQYQKAVEKSKATQAFVVLKSVQQAFEAYRLANGEYPSKFEDAAISFPNMTGNVAQLVTSSDYSLDSISDKDWSLEISTSNTGTFSSVSMSRISGKYAGAGFRLSLFSTDPQRIGKLFCVERLGGANFILKEPGSYCKKIFKGTLYSQDSYVILYSL